MECQEQHAAISPRTGQISQYSRRADQNQPTTHLKIETVSIPMKKEIFVLLEKSLEKRCLFGYDYIIDKPAPGHKKS